MNRDSIIRKLNSLRQLADHPSTEPAIVEASMRKFNALMQEYNLTLTDLEVKSSSVHGFTKSHPKKSPVSFMGYIVLSIAELTDTKVVSLKADNYTFLGLMADLQYANWLYELIAKNMESGAIAYKMSPDYHKRINMGVKADKAMDAFKTGYTKAIVTALDKMIAENKIAGKALVLVKNEIIQAFMDENKLEGEAKNDIIKFEGLHEVAYMGHEEGKKVKLRKETENQIKGYLA